MLVTRVLPWPQARIEGPAGGTVDCSDTVTTLNGTDSHTDGRRIAVREGLDASPSAAPDSSFPLIRTLGSSK